VERRYLPRILQDGTGALALVPATLVGSAATAELTEIGAARAAALADAAERGGGLWVVARAAGSGPTARAAGSGPAARAAGSGPAARAAELRAAVVTAPDLLGGAWEHLRDSDVPALFDGEAPRALLLDALDPVDLLVPVDGWEPGRTFYFHSESPLFAAVPVLAKRDHRVTVRRGQVSDEARKLIGRRMVEGQTCGVLANELGGLCVVPDGEVATDVRAVYAERIRFIVDGMRDVGAAATVIGEWAERLRTAATAGWVLERPIENSFLYAVNRRRLRTLLPLPAPGALVPVGAAVDVPVPDAGADPGPVSALPGLAEVAPLAAAAADAAVAGDGPVVVDPLVHLARELIERFAAELVARVPEPLGGPEPAAAEGSLPVLRRNVFRRPRGRLLRIETSSRLVAAALRVRAGEVEVIRGRVPDDAAGRLAAALAEGPGLDGDWALCRGAFGYVLAELGAPLRAVESLSSSTSYAHLLDGAGSLDEASDRLAEVAARLERLAAEGWTLSQPIVGFWLRLRPRTPFG
jgi:hypothetical protein